MKPLLKKATFGILGLLYLFSTPCAISAFSLWGDGKMSDSQESYVYEKKDAGKDKKRYLIKLEQDARKCDLAITNTKTLISRSKNRPYLPELYLRMAELYIEKSRLVYFLRKSQQTGNGSQALDQYEANALKTQAIEVYQRIVNQHPDFSHLDKVHFFMAHEYHELGRTGEMIAEYRTLLKKFPQSLYAPEAHLLLGDYHFNQKADVDAATKHYQAVLGYPNSPAIAAARYKLAWCKINQTDFKKALELFEASVTSPNTSKDHDIDTYRRVDVRLESLVDMAYCYTEVYKKSTAKEALAYFKKYAWSRQVYTTVLEKLAYRYYVKKKWSQASPLYRELAVIRQDPEALLEYARHIFECVQTMGTYNEAEKDVSIIVRALKQQVYSLHMADAEKEKLIHDYEIFARDIITHLHAKARRTNSHTDFAIAAGAYGQYLDFFTQSPAVEEMSANYAETLFSSGRYLEAGKQYEKCTPAATISTKRRKESLYSSVISYYRALKNKDNQNFYQAAYAREGLRSIGKTFVEEYPQSPQAPDVYFNVAWASYDAGDFKTAIKDLSEFARRHPRHKASGAAIHLVMDSYHLLEDYEGLVRYGNGVLADANLHDTKLKAEVAQIVQGAGSKVVSNITVAAVNDWESARQELLQVADQSKKTKMGEQALQSLILSSRDKRDLATLFDAGNKLISQYPESIHARETLGVLIDASVSIGQLRLLADYLEMVCRQYPKEEKTDEFLLKAATIREGLGQYALANANYRKLLAKRVGVSGNLDEILFAMVDNMQRLDQPANAIKVLTKHQNRLSKGGKYRSYAQLAVLHMDSDHKSQAKKYYRLAKKYYRPGMGEQNPSLQDLMAQLAYRKVYGNSGKYYQLRLKNEINNTIVQKKASLLNQLEMGYQEVLTLKSPAWTLKACFRANEINAEFASFLVNAPLPSGLTAEQKEQYNELIRKKAQAYIDKSQNYLKTCVELASKWEICDPSLSGYFNPPENPQGKEGVLKSISTDQAVTAITLTGMRQSSLADIYKKLLSNSNDEKTQFQLAKTYSTLGDFPQAALIAKNVLPKIKGNQRHLKAEILNLIGLSYLYEGSDSLAKESFKRALKANSNFVSARLNLAGVYRYYGHDDKADELLQNVSQINPIPDSVHPKFRADDSRMLQGSEQLRAVATKVKL